MTERVLRAALAPAHDSSQNHLLSALPTAEYERLAPHLELVALPGHYRLIAGVLFAFDTPLPEGEPAPAASLPTISLLSTFDGGATWTFPLRRLAMRSRCSADGMVAARCSASST